MKITLEVPEDVTGMLGEDPDALVRVLRLAAAQEDLNRQVQAAEVAHKQKLEALQKQVAQKWGV